MRWCEKYIGKSVMETMTTVISHTHMYHNTHGHISQCHCEVFGDHTIRHLVITLTARSGAADQYRDVVTHGMWVHVAIKHNIIWVLHIKPVNLSYTISTLKFVLY